jgi:hypothetical protein
MAYDPNDLAKIRYAPTYGAINSKRYASQHRLDLRYSYRTTYEWGYVSWYLEAIYITNLVKQEDWKYNEPYIPGMNPAMVKPDRTIPFIPLFGVEIKF